MRSWLPVSVVLYLAKHVALYCMRTVDVRCLLVSDVLDFAFCRLDDLQASFTFILRRHWLMRVSCELHTE